ncbi:unnamed protein product [Prunus armeniaca]
MPNSRAEVWGLFFGLKLALEKGLRDLAIEMDSSLVVKLCLKPSLLGLHPMASLIDSCCDLMKQLGKCTLKHIYGEKNRVANATANWSYNLDLGLCTFDTALSWISSCLVDDVLGALRIRSVCLDQCD